MFVACIAIFVSFGLSYGIPTNNIEPILSPIAHVNENAIPSDIVQEIERNSLGDRNAEDLQTPNYHAVIRLSDSEATDVIFDPPIHTSCDQDGMERVPAMEYDLFSQAKLPRWPDQYSQLAQESNQVNEEQEPVKISMDIAMNNYDDDDNELPNPVLYLDSLPNVYSTHTQEVIPFFKARVDSNIDVFKDENNEAQLLNRRPNRSEDEEYARLIAELEHDAMMNNIMPTMSYVRDALEYEARPQLHAGIFPRRTSSGCGLPILLGCKPNYVDGVLINSN